MKAHKWRTARKIDRDRVGATPSDLLHGGKLGMHERIIYGLKIKYGRIRWALSHDPDSSNKTLRSFYKLTFNGSRATNELFVEVGQY